MSGISFPQGASALRYIGLTLLVIASSPDDHGLEDETAATLAARRDILNAWERRSINIPSAIFEWDEHTIVFQGTQPAGMPGLESGYPAEDVMQEHRSRLILGTGPQIFYERVGPIWSADENTFKPCRYISTFDGRKATSGFLGNTYNNRNNLYVSEAFQEYDNARLWAVIYSLRAGLQPLSFLDPNLWQVNTEPAVHQEISCCVISQTDSVGSRRSIFLDPGRQYLPLRVTIESGGAVNADLRVSYERDEKVGELPKAWQFSGFGTSGVMDCYFEAKVTSCSIDLLDQAAKTFDIEIPPGSLVQDGRDATITVVRNDGTSATFLQSEFDQGTLPVGAFDLDSPPVGMVQRPGRNLVMILAGNALLLIVAWIASRRWRRSSAAG